VERERVFEFAPGGLSFMELARLGARFEDHSVGASAVNNRKQAADRRRYFYLLISQTD
jgi:hypothetical protein